MTRLQIAPMVGFAALLSLTACSVGKAPLSNPADMTAGGHCDAARQERALASEHERQGSNVFPSKPAVEQRLRSEHFLKVKKHRDYARQHEEAAVATADGIRCENPWE